MARGQLDRFSTVAKGYARYRPTYPASLYEFLLSRVDRHRAAWDVGTGNGQVACVLAKSFENVIATDISASQLAEATAASNISYRVFPAEETDIASNSINLITVGQAAHWFDIPRFSEEVYRVSAPDSLLAIWCYVLFRTGSELDTLVDFLYRDILDDYWDPHRQLVNQGYASLEFPFTELTCPDFQIQNMWTADDILGYLRTWSAASKYYKAHGKDPVLQIEEELKHLLAGKSVLCTTPVYMRAWRIKT